jgi:hypothetical protein
VDEADLHKNELGAPRDEVVGSAHEASEGDRDLPQFKPGRRDFPVAWSKAANEGLVSDEEYVTELLRHTRAENERIMPGVSWPKDLYEK